MLASTCDEACFGVTGLESKQAVSAMRAASEPLGVRQKPKRWTNAKGRHFCQPFAVYGAEVGLEPTPPD